MNTPLTAVMYHYVRPLSRTRFPEIKALDLHDYREQIDYIARHYAVVAMEDVIAAIDSGEDLPPRAALLTFDDGYADHYDYAFPVLFDRKLPGCFYAPRSTALERDILDVNKVHFILAAAGDKIALADEVEKLTDAARGRFDLPGAEELRRIYAVPNRFDPAEVNYVKRILQHALPSALRSELAGELFRRTVSADPIGFAEELYMSLEQMRVMAGCGMHFGGHGDRHVWLSRVPQAEKSREIAGARELLDAIGVPGESRSFCYPYGDYDTATIALLRANDFRIAFTARVDLARPSAETRFELPRLDTNDLPKTADAQPNEWTRRVLN